MAMVLARVLVGWQLLNGIMASPSGMECGGSVYRHGASSVQVRSWRDARDAGGSGSANHNPVFTKWFSSIKPTLIRVHWVR